MGTTPIVGGQTALVAYAQSARSTRRYRVNIEQRTCECTFPTQHRLPCRHMIAFYKQDDELGQLVFAAATAAGGRVLVVLPVRLGARHQDEGYDKDEGAEDREEGPAVAWL